MDVIKGGNAMRITIIKNILSDGSANFDLLIQHEGESVTMELVCETDYQADVLVNRIHEAMEAATCDHIPWNDMMERLP
jgi:hypothetical protein